MDPVLSGGRAVGGHSDPTTPHTNLDRINIEPSQPSAATFSGTIAQRPRVWQLTKVRRVSAAARRRARRPSGDAAGDEPMQMNANRAKV